MGTEQMFSATHTFDAVFGQSHQPFFGGGLQVIVKRRVLRRGRRVALSQDRRAGVRLQQPDVPARPSADGRGQAARGHRRAAVRRAPEPTFRAVMSAPGSAPTPTKSRRLRPIRTKTWRRAITGFIVGGVWNSGCIDGSACTSTSSTPTSRAFSGWRACRSQRRRTTWAASPCGSRSSSAAEARRLGRRVSPKARLFPTSVGGCIIEAGCSHHRASPAQCPRRRRRGPLRPVSRHGAVRTPRPCLPLQDADSLHRVYVESRRRGVRMPLPQ